MQVDIDGEPDIETLVSAANRSQIIRHATQQIETRSMKASITPFSEEDELSKVLRSIKTISVAKDTGSNTHGRPIGHKKKKAQH